MTGNVNKAREVERILSQHSLPVHVSQADLSLPELQGSPVEVCEAKTREAFSLLQKPVIVEDTSLDFSALGGLPGPYIKHFVTRLGAEGLPRLLADFDDKRAVARTIVGFADGNETRMFIGEVSGRIVFPRGSTNFGWDPVFQPDDFDVTYAEMDPAVKNSMSHRARAVNQFVEYLQQKWKNA